MKKSLGLTPSGGSKPSRRARPPAPDLKTRELVTPHRRARLYQFAAELVDLCNKYHVDIESSVLVAELIVIVERDFKYPEGYQYSAAFQGIDKDGIWNIFNPQ